jgi:signal transduction histidine kinase
MTSRFQFILAAAFGSLIGLLGVAGFESFRRANQIYEEISYLHESYRRGEQVLGQVQADIHLAGVLVRDYLLDPSQITGQLYREKLISVREGMQDQFDALQKMIGAEDAGRLSELRAEVDAYWSSVNPLFEWSPQEKSAFSAYFLRKVVLPRRDAALKLAVEIGRLHQAQISRQRASIDAKQEQFRSDLGRLLALAMSLGLAVALASMVRLYRLERQAENSRRRTEKAEQELRRLSQQLVRGQEEERKAISRELHDQVGQMLTALRMEIGTLQQLREADETQFRAHAQEAKKLSEETLRAVRDMAMGLRPSMLDDLGLGPALEWQAREFSRRFGVPVSVQLEGDLDTVGERQRTCIYRVVQEALTNCARHAGATEIRITARGEPHRVSLQIQDNGAGFDLNNPKRKGLGLIGIQERVRELEGSVKILAQPGKGTVLAVDLPAAREVVT